MALDNDFYGIYWLFPRRCEDYHETLFYTLTFSQTWASHGAFEALASFRIVGRTWHAIQAQFGSVL